MPVYIKYIRGRAYYYEQYSVYQGPGLPPKTPTRYLGPVNPTRRKGRIAAFIEANFKYEPGEVAAEKALREYSPPLDKTKLAAQSVVPIEKPVPAVSLHSSDAVPGEKEMSSEASASTIDGSDQASSQ